MDSAIFYSERTLTDIAQWDSSAFGAAIDIVQLSTGRFRSKQQIVDLGALQILQLTINQSITARGREQTSRYAAVLFDQSYDGDFARASIQKGRMFLLPPYIQFDGCVKDRDFTCAATFVDATYLENHYSVLSGMPSNRLRENQPGIVVDDDIGARIGLCSHAVLNAARDNAPELQQIEYRKSVIDEIVTLMIHAFLAKDIEADIKPPTRVEKAKRLVHQAEDYIKSHPSGPVRLVDLCQHCDVSERTLQYAFRHVLSLSPIQYLNRFRMHQVHAALCDATPRTTTVAAEACRWGFWHLSEFAGNYRDLFEELPSETLQSTR